MLCFIVDLFIESYWFEIKADPISLLRKVISNKEDMAKHDAEF